MNKKKWIYISGGLLALTSASFVVYKGFPQVWYNWFKVKLWDSKTEDIINRLHPKIRGKTRAFIKASEKKGYKLKITSGLRTFEEQDNLYAKGRTSSGNIVTNARAGSSYHNFGLAFDVVEIVNGSAIWDNPNWKEIGNLGKKYGFEWGGDWTGFVDKPHFQFTYGFSTNDLFTKVGNNTGQYVRV